MIMIWRLHVHREFPPVGWVTSLNPASFKRLLLLKATGRYKRLSPEDTAGTTIPQAFAFSQNYPNPFNPTTSFKFALPRDCHVKLEILNILGQKVATILNEWREAGIHEVSWNGELNSGNPVASGVYFATIKAGEFSSTKKVVVIK